VPGLPKAQLHLRHPGEALLNPSIELMIQRARAAPLLWYENDERERFVLGKADSEPAPETGFKYQHSRFPASLHHAVLLVKDGKSSPVATAVVDYSTELVLALCRPLQREQELQLDRYGFVMLGMEFDKAVLAAASCERCMNAFAHRAGLEWGYPVGSTKWQQAGTSCELCEVPGG
jgi:hypothetical protein